MQKIEADYRSDTGEAIEDEVVVEAVGEYEQDH